MLLSTASFISPFLEYTHIFNFLICTILCYKSSFNSAISTISICPLYPTQSTIISVENQIRSCITWESFSGSQNTKKKISKLLQNRKKKSCRFGPYLAKTLILYNLFSTKLVQPQYYYAKLYPDTMSLHAMSPPFWILFQYKHTHTSHMNFAHSQMLLIFLVLDLMSPLQQDLSWSLALSIPLILNFYFSPLFISSSHLPQFLIIFFISLRNTVEWYLHDI